MELLFFSCLILVCIIYGIDKHHLEQSKAVLMEAISSNAEYTARLEKKLAELEEKLLENPGLMKTPVVRNGKKATVGYAPEEWAQWE